MTNIEEILSQKFKYLTEALQTVVYLSEDEKYILKTFKTLEQSKLQFEKWGLNPKDITSELITNSEISYNLAYKHLKDETALVYLHLNQEVPVKEINLNGDKMDTSKLKFLVQYKVELVRDRLTKLMNNGLVDEAKKVFDDIFNFVKNLWDRGITEDTFNWDHNYGYDDVGRIVQIDVGTFYQGQKYIEDEIKNRKLLDSVSYRWLQDNFPVLLEYYRNKVEKFYIENAIINK